MLKAGDILIAKEEIKMYDRLTFIKGKRYKVKETYIRKILDDNYYYFIVDSEWLENMNISFEALDKFDILRDIRKQKLEKLL